MSTVVKNEKDTKAPATATGPAMQERVQQANEERTRRIDAAEALRGSIRRMEDLSALMSRNGDDEAADAVDRVVAKLCRIRDRDWRTVSDKLRGP